MKMPLRHRLAWWLVRIAAKLHWTEHTQAIVIKNREGFETARFYVTADAYGCGIASGPTSFGNFTVEFDFDGELWDEEVKEYQ